MSIKNIIIGFGLAALCSNVALAKNKTYFCDIKTDNSHAIRLYGHNVAGREEVKKVVAYNIWQYGFGRRDSKILKSDNCHVTHRNNDPNLVEIGCTVNKVSLIVDFNVFPDNVNTLSQNPSDIDESYRCAYYRNPRKKISNKKILQMLDHLVQTEAAKIESIKFCKRYDSKPNLQEACLLTKLSFNIINATDEQRVQAEVATNTKKNDNSAKNMEHILLNGVSFENDQNDTSFSYNRCERTRVALDNLSNDNIKFLTDECEARHYNYILTNVRAVIPYSDDEDVPNRIIWTSLIFEANNDFQAHLDCTEIISTLNALSNDKIKFLTGICIKESNGKYVSKNIRAVIQPQVQPDVVMETKQEPVEPTADERYQAEVTKACNALGWGSTGKLCLSIRSDPAVTKACGTFTHSLEELCLQKQLKPEVISACGALGYSFQKICLQNKPKPEVTKACGTLGYSFQNICLQNKPKPEVTKACGTLSYSFQNICLQNKPKPEVTKACGTLGYSFQKICLQNKPKPEVTKACGTLGYSFQKICLQNKPKPEVTKACGTLSYSFQNICLQNKPKPEVTKACGTLSYSFQNICLQNKPKPEVTKACGTLSYSFQNICLQNKPKPEVTKACGALSYTNYRK